MDHDRIDISTLANTAGVSTRVLRHYVDIGLLSTEDGETSGRIRHFRKSVVIEVSDILALRELGYTLCEIGVLLQKKLTEAVDFRIDPNCRSRDELIWDLDAKARSIKTLREKLSQ